VKEKFSMVRIRLRRVGAKGQPSYRIVAADKESPRDGRFLEILGFYNPRTEPATIQVKEERVYDWMSKGAQPTESVAQVFRTVGILDRFERFKKGETLETLLEEAEKVQAARVVSPKTSLAAAVRQAKKTETEE
jgi:small subunit ribosomal protein S16